MIFEEEPHAFVNEINNTVNSFEINTPIFNLGNTSSFILNSLHKIKQSTCCEIKRSKIEKFINEFGKSIKNNIDHYHHNQSEIKDYTTYYAKQSYHRVVIEQEYLEKLMTTLNKE